MTTRELTEQLAAQQDIPPEQAADEVARVVSSILVKLRKGSPVPLPGLGVLESNGDRSVSLRPTIRKKGKR